jgi:hypothetical protein
MMAMMIPVTVMLPPEVKGESQRRRERPNLLGSVREYPIFSFPSAAAAVRLDAEDQSRSD